MCAMIDGGYPQIEEPGRLLMSFLRAQGHGFCCGIENVGLVIEPLQRVTDIRKGKLRNLEGEAILKQGKGVDLVGGTGGRFQGDEPITFFTKEYRGGDTVRFKIAQDGVHLADIQCLKIWKILNRTHHRRWAERRKHGCHGRLTSTGGES